MRKLCGVTLALTTLIVTAGPAFADPCGMVPPIDMNMRVASAEPLIKRIGTQNTYVAYHRGMETMVLRPGFRGRIDEFGMLIPFPNPPSVRKVDDDIFAHLHHAVYPPPVVAYVPRPAQYDDAYGIGYLDQSAGLRGKQSSALGKGLSSKEPVTPRGLRYHVVNVVEHKAVGMYEVAVLEAGSVGALTQWMQSHGFRYPDGMEKVTQEYVDTGWVFVAIKTQVGNQKGVNPTPGMRAVRAELPSGAEFSGFVQAMGFRFESDELVVPMRLSAFNAGELHNRLYVLTDDPVAIANMPQELVSDQMSGRTLRKNLTEPLPLTVVNGTEADLGLSQRQQIRKQRKPGRVNGHARELIASDLQAFKQNKLAHEREDQETALLEIGKELGLDGDALDALHRKILEDHTHELTEQLDDMTLTIIDGELDRDAIAKKNVTFVAYRLDVTTNPAFGLQSFHPAAALLIVVAFALLFFRRRGGIAVLLVAAGAVGVPAMATAAPKQVEIEKLIHKVRYGDDIEHRGRAVVALRDVGGPRVKQAFDAMLRDWNPKTRAQSIEWVDHGSGRALMRFAPEAALEVLDPKTELVATWVAAARIELARDSEVRALLPLSRTYPLTTRALAKRVVTNVETRSGLNTYFIALYQYPAMITPADVATAQRSFKLEPMLHVMLHSTNAEARRAAAGYVGSLGTPEDVLKRLRFDPKAKRAPWHGGPLFIPGFGWSRDDARELSDQLIRWMVWAHHSGDVQVETQARNNLANWGLMNAGGFRMTGTRDTLVVLKQWRSIRGDDHVREMLEQQNLHEVGEYSVVLE